MRSHSFSKIGLQLELARDSKTGIRPRMTSSKYSSCLKVIVSRDLDHTATCMDQCPLTALMQDHCEMISLAAK